MTGSVVVAIAAAGAGQQMGEHPMPAWLAAALIIFAAVCAVWLLCVLIADWFKHH